MPGTGFQIESRKRHIPHANGMGMWDHTTYWVLKDGKELVEKHSLADAKEYAEARIKEAADVKEAETCWFSIQMGQSLSTVNM